MTHRREELALRAGGGESAVVGFLRRGSQRFALALALGVGIGIGVGIGGRIGAAIARPFDVSGCRYTRAFTIVVALEGTEVAAHELVP
ncbi:MAG: hypothetical protein HOQ09_13480 [Gemmatimonadaceae bacterium]|nr:hypothetical protein [Gemmatimonadaceae bacterium]